MLDAGGHRKKLLNKDDASESMVHNYAYICVYAYFYTLKKKGGNCVYGLYDPAAGS